MATKAAVVIGVNKTGGLPVLRGAVAGAISFAQWAETNGFDVQLLTDETGPVTIDAISTAITKLVEARTYSQLIVHFSGHGLLRGTFELWMLSGAPEKSGEAVNVPLSIDYARNVGIPHVIFISDACRSLPTTILLNAVAGNAIFPVKSPTPRPRPQVDEFYATLLGDSAFEAPAADRAAENYKAVFTDCLLKGLTDTGEDATEIRREPKPLCHVISSWKLKDYLERTVPEAAAAISSSIEQVPDIRVESRLPNCFVDFPQRPVVAGFRGWASEESSHGSVSRENPTNRNPLSDDDQLQRFFAAFVGRPKIIAGLVLVSEANNRWSFETGVGFTVVGAKVTKAAATGLTVDVFEENGAAQIRVHPLPNLQRGASIFIQFDSGNCSILAILPEFIGTVVVEKGRVISVTYVPSGNSARYPGYAEHQEAIKLRHAVIATAARFGAFRIEPGMAARSANYLRALKAFDPTLCLYAAYAFAQIGAREEIVSVYEYMALELEPILFDVALLAGRLSSESPDRHRLAPFCPMLNQGWALLGPAEEFLPPSVRAARPSLLPGLWTTFGPEGADPLLEALSQHSLP
ncbi:MAG: Peptidase caspase catalytic subunit p20 [Chthoniobacteraceae bacterium]|nr:Peptidase caspase catalytic subunit p20 [Chthoniobacteraceae bacterium]